MKVQIKKVYCPIHTQLEMFHSEHFDKYACQLVDCTYGNGTSLNEIVQTGYADYLLRLENSHITDSWWEDD